MIATLIDSDHAYVTDDGVYMSVESVDDYGLLAHQSVDDMRSGGGDREVVGAAGKRHPADFVLWKFATGPATESDPAWPSPWGDGRPGWHSECVVMSLDLLGEGFDLHCGGQDLRFPHHENERAQAVALGKRFANHWMHNGFVVDAEGEKMSKSLGNVSNLLDLIEHYDPRAYRMVLLQSHYRSPVKITQDGIDAAVKSLAGLDAFAARVAAVDADEPDAAVLDEFRAAMDDDLDTPRATRCCSTRFVEPTLRSMPATTAPVGSLPQFTRSPELSGSTSARSPTSTPTRSPAPRRSTTRELRRTSPPPTRCEPDCRPTDGPSRPPATAPRFGGDVDRRPVGPTLPPNVTDRHAV